MKYGLSKGKDHILGLPWLIYDVIPSAEWVFITLEMNIITQIDINTQREAISVGNHILFWWPHPPGLARARLINPRPHL